MNGSTDKQPNEICSALIGFPLNPRNPNCLESPIRQFKTRIKCEKHGLGVFFRWNIDVAHVSDNFQHFSKFDLFDLFDLLQGVQAEHDTRIKTRSLDIFSCTDMYLPRDLVSAPSQLGITQITFCKVLLLPKDLPPILESAYCIIFWCLNYGKWFDFLNSLFIKKYLI